MKTTQKGISLSRVLDQIGLCAAGCGTRTRTGVCAECARYDPEVCRQRRTEEKNRQIRALGRSGGDVRGTCLSCANWRDRCLMEIPECSLSWAKKCSCYLPVEVVA
jgi:hypothetical protein